MCSGAVGPPLLLGGLEGCYLHLLRALCSVLHTSGSVSGRAAPSFRAIGVGPRQVLITRCPRSRHTAASGHSKIKPHMTLHNVHVLSLQRS